MLWWWKIPGSCMSDPWAKFDGWKPALALQLVYISRWMYISSREGGQANMCPSVCWSKFEQASLHLFTLFICWWLRRSPSIFAFKATMNKKQSELSLCLSYVNELYSWTVEHNHLLCRIMLYIATNQLLKVVYCWKDSRWDAESTGKTEFHSS